MALLPCLALHCTSLSPAKPSCPHWLPAHPLFPAPSLARRRKLLPRSGASITYVPAPGGGPGRVFVFGGQEPVSGAILDELLVRGSYSHTLVWQP